MALRLFGRIEIHRKATKVVVLVVARVCRCTSRAKRERSFARNFWRWMSEENKWFLMFLHKNAPAIVPNMYSALMYFIGTEKQKPWDIEIIAQIRFVFYYFDPKLVGCRKYPGRTHPGRRCKSILTLASFVLRCHLLKWNIHCCVVTNEVVTSILHQINRTDHFIYIFELNMPHLKNRGSFPWNTKG